jgi:hypothetical protein
MTIADYFTGLALTLIIECSVAALLGYRTRVQLQTVALASLITHPALCYFLWVNAYLWLVPDTGFTIIVLELIVVLVEWLVLVFVLRENRKRLFLLSFTMNCASFLTGVAIYGL